MAKNKGKPYTDSEIDLILTTVPSRENIQLLADVLERTTGGIELVYRHAHAVLPESKKGNFSKQVNARRRALNILKLG